MEEWRKKYGDTGNGNIFIRSNSQDNHNVFPHVVQTRSRSSFLNRNSRAKQVVDHDRIGKGKQLNHTSGAAHCKAEITVSEVETALAYLRTKKDSDSNLFYETKIVEGRLASLFVADSVAQLDYACFGDVMAVCRMNSYKMHFVILAGLNHHHQTCIFGCALLHDETVEAYSWLFQTLLHVMQGCMPKSVVTDGHESVCKAIKHALPRSRHRLCAWHLENDAHSIVDDPSFISDFKVCMLEALSLDDFEVKWKVMVGKYKLFENSWIHSMYEKRHMWADAYFKGHFCAGLKSTRLCESIYECLSRFAQHKLKLCQFIDLFDKAVLKLRWNEGKVEYDATSESFALSTRVKIEKHAAEVFTRESYRMFLSEMWLETHLFVLNKHDGSNIRKYRLGSSKHHSLACDIMFKPSGPSIKCSCLKFETTGFPCCHAIHIIKCEQLEKIPRDLIHPRWTKSAKSTAQFWQGFLPPVSNDVVTRMMRYGNLMSHCLVLSYLGSKSDQIFNLVHNRLQKLMHEIKELSFSPHASNSGALGIPTKVKDGGPVSRSERSKSDDDHSRNVEQIKHKYPKLISAGISVADKCPIVMQATLCNSSDKA
ncbi:protein FAR1-RELATED SEQUENCE 5 [Cajanus cajan]|uniref:Protein FAR1-RELATED SEQUENCE n=1 Tax=Cajanus cajan TaxID=3821 RepID=A0A151T4A8_CAJCA|nr:protein FAR1-RELATED SEQUENCE 5 [Cajanus cajan]KYP61886.1 Protein FAR1-RELATED SEQUENCE 5 [Cajanus cajan]